MGIATFPAVSGGGIKSVQRGSASAAGNVTITAVDIAKSFVTVFGSASSGTVAATGALSAATGANGTSYMTTEAEITGSSQGAYSRTFGNISASNISLNVTNLSGGTNNLVAAVVTGFLANSTTLTVSGACRYEVVEFN
jgi:hypothetical protein